MNPESLLIASVCLAAVPILISVGTCYLKFSIVLSLLRSGFGTQQAPSGALITALSLVMSVVVMHPVFEETYDIVRKQEQLNDGVLNFRAIETRLSEFSGPWREFLRSHAGEREQEVFKRITSRSEVPPENSSNSLTVLLASFVLTEIKKAFTLSFFLLIPFFVIDIIVANLLVAMGLTMMSPVIVSLPVKLLLFISTDGWLMLSKNLIQAYF